MTLKIALAQVNSLVGDIAGNADSVIEAAMLARDRQGARVVVFPELTLTGYPPEDLLLRSELTLRIERELERICGTTAGIDLALGYPRVANGRLFNTAGLIRDGRILAEYHKQYLRNYSVFDEKRYSAPGRDACVCDIGGVPVGITICEDIWETRPAAQAAAARARLLLNLNASPFHYGKAPEREELLSKRPSGASRGTYYPPGLRQGQALSPHQRVLIQPPRNRVYWGPTENKVELSYEKSRCDNQAVQAG